MYVKDTDLRVQECLINNLLNSPLSQINNFNSNSRCRFAVTEMSKLHNVDLLRIT